MEIKWQLQLRGVSFGLETAGLTVCQRQNGALILHIKYLSGS